MLSTVLAAALSCHVVFSGGQNGNWKEKLDHEMAHCNGWVHPEQDAPQHGAAYKAFLPPKKFIHRYRGRVVLEHVTLEDAMKKCDGHFACQWFE